MSTHERHAKLHMLVFDSAYTYKIMIERSVADIVTGRDLGGYFDHIWTCHPVASLLEPPESPERFGQPQTYDLAPRHTLVEGCIGRFPWMAWFPVLNFLFAQVQLLRLLFHLVRKQDIRFVRAEDPYYNGLLALAVAAVRKLPLIICVYGNPKNVRATTGVPLLPRLFRKVWVEEKVERFVLRRADLVIVQNEDNRRFVLDAAGIPVERTRIFRLGNLLHDGHFVPPQERADGRGDLAALGVPPMPTLLVVSRLQELKLVHHVLFAVKTLKDRGLRVFALFVGDGPFRERMEEMIDELQISDQVLLCGNREQSWLARVVPAVSVVVSPLTGRALAEAALGAARIAAYDIDWHSELIETGETGELVPYLDHQALADAIGRLIENPERAARMGAALRRRAMEMMDPVTINRAQVAAYEFLATAKGGRDAG